MSMKPTLARRHPLTHLLATTLACIVAIGILAAVTELFQRSGAPMEQLAAAERACVDHAYVSERDACMRRWLMAARSPNMASK